MHNICVSVFTCIMHKNRSQVVSQMLSMWAGRSVVLPAETRQVSLLQNNQNGSSTHPASTQWVPQALAPTQPLLNGYHRLLPLGYSRGSIKLTTHLHLMPRWMSLTIHLLLLLAIVVWTTWPFTVTKLKIHSYCKTYPMQTYFVTNPRTAVHHACHFSSSLLKPGIVSSTNFASCLMKPMTRVTKLWPGDSHKQRASEATVWPVPQPRWLQNSAKPTTREQSQQNFKFSQWCCWGLQFSGIRSCVNGYAVPSVPRIAMPSSTRVQAVQAGSLVLRTKALQTIRTSGNTHQQIYHTP